MSVRPPSLAVAAALLAVLPAGAQTGTAAAATAPTAQLQQASQRGASGRGGVPSIVELPETPLDTLAPEARAAIQTRRDDLAKVAAEGEADPEALARAYGELGKAYLAVEHAAPAEAALRNAAALDPREPRWQYYLGLLALERRGLEDAVDRFGAVTQLLPEQPAAWIRLGGAQLDLGRLDEADAAFAHAVELRPELAAGHHGRGRVALARGDDAAAIRLLEQAIALQPEARKLHAPLSQAYRRQGLEDLATKHAELYAPADVSFPEPMVTEIRLATESAAFHLAAGERAVLEERWDFARRSFERALELEPESGRARRGLAALARREGDAERALDLLQEAARLAPGDSGLRLELARFHVERSAWDEAAREVAAALELDPGSEPARLLQAGVAFARKDYEGALAAYDVVLAHSPQHRDALVERAATLAAMGRLDAARDELEAVLAQVPGEPRASLELARVLVERGESERARTLFEEIAGKQAAPEPVRARAHYELGLLEATRDSAATAIAAFERALELDPTFDDARFELGNVLGRTGDFEGAAARYAELVGRQPQRVAARLGLATALLLRGRPAGARDALVEGLRAVPGDRNLTHALARLLASSPDPAVRDGQRALELAQTVFRQAKTMEHAETVAMAYAEMGAFDDAVRWQRTLLAEAERLGEAGWIGRLRANLERYQRGERP